MKSTRRARYAVATQPQHTPSLPPPPFASRQDGFISFVEFERMTYRSKLLMFPAFQIIAALHERIQGASFWRRLTQRRNERYPRMFLLDIIESLSVKVRE